MYPDMYEYDPKDRVATLLMTLVTFLMFLVLGVFALMVLAGVVSVGAHYVFGFDLTWWQSSLIVFGFLSFIFLLSIPGVTKYE